LAAFDAASANAATPLYPDLKTLPPRDLRFDNVFINGQTHKILRFTNTVWNRGPGRLEVRGKIDPNTLVGPAVQRVYDDAGGYTDYTVGQFKYHPAHDHYHFEDWGRYQLWTKADYDAFVASGGTTGSPIIGTKTTSCILDEEFIRQVPRQPYPPVYNFRGCQPDSNWQMLQGISPGWGDTYHYFRAEQWIDLGPGGSLPAGRYVLRSVSDPLNKIYESPAKGDSSKEGGQDNAAITNFSIQAGQIVDSDPPSGSVMINNIAEATANPAVTVKVLGRDDVSGVTKVRLSNNGTAWSNPQSYTGDGSTMQSISWDLSNPTYGGTSADGTKTVYVEFRDASGKWSAPATDTIELDRTGASSAYSNAVLGDGPAAYWRLGESSGTTALDATGGDNGAYRNGVQLARSSLLIGDPNTSAHFDGANDFVNVPSSTALSPPGAISLEAWIYPDSLPASGSFASIITKPGAYSLQFNGPSLELTIFQSGVKRRLQAPVGTIQAGHTYHVVGTYDGSTERLYVNGSQVVSKALTGAITTGTSNLRIGSWGGGSEFFAGRIDEPAVYTAALSSSQVSEHHQAGIGGP
jgi:hypothetical protein